MSTFLRKNFDFFRDVSLRNITGTWKHNKERFTWIISVFEATLNILPGFTGFYHGAGCFFLKKSKTLLNFVRFYKHSIRLEGFYFLRDVLLRNLTRNVLLESYRFSRPLWMYYLVLPGFSYGAGCLFFLKNNSKTWLIFVRFTNTRYDSKVFSFFEEVL